MKKLLGIVVLGLLMSVSAANSNLYNTINNGTIYEGMSYRDFEIIISGKIGMGDKDRKGYYDNFYTSASSDGKKFGDYKVVSFYNGLALITLHAPNSKWNAWGFGSKTAYVTKIVAHKYGDKPDVGKNWIETKKHLKEKLGNIVWYQSNKWNTNRGKLLALDNAERDREKFLIAENKRKEEEEKKKEEEKRKAEKPKEKKKKEPKQTEQKSNDEKIYSVGSGTGFFINRSGHIVSNNHVIDSCNAVKLHYKGKVTPVTILATDRSNDLSLMKVETKPDDVFPVAIDDANLLDDIFVAGFPFGKDVSSSVKVTKGVVSALTGIANNYSNIQIDAALQPGNSGGPIINKEGNVVGVAVAKLDYKKILEMYDTIPEGTNFGIKSSTVQQFIKANNVKSIQPSRREMSTKDIGTKIQKATVYLDCFMTAQRYEQLKSKKVMYKNIE